MRTLCVLLMAMALSACSTASAIRRPAIRAWRGATPALDGVISPGEYDDATGLSGVRDWTAQFSPVTGDADLSIVGWVKHDGENLYFAFRVTDDVLYGIDTPRWLPDTRPHAHELTPRGYPWFGDEIELLISARPQANAKDGQSCAGDGSSWQMVCNLTKSRLGGIGKGGLMEGEPRSVPSAWNTYRQWIETGAMRAAAKSTPDGKGYVIEWMIRPNPCLEVSPGVFWSPALGVVTMGLNIALGDLDEKARGADNKYGFHHEQWWAGQKDKRTWLNQWGTLALQPGPKPK